MFLGNEITKSGITDDNEMYLRCKTLLEQYAVGYWTPNTKVGELGLGNNSWLKLPKH